MKNKELFDALRDIDDKFILEADPDFSASKAPKPSKMWIIPLAATFICLAAVMGMIFFPASSKQEPPPPLPTDEGSLQTQPDSDTPSEITPTETVPAEPTETVPAEPTETVPAEPTEVEPTEPDATETEYVEITLSAEDVGNLFDYYKEDNSSTTSYTKIYYPSYRPLKTEALPTGEYAYIYKINGIPKAVSQVELEEFISGIAPKLSESLGLDIDTLERHETVRDDRLSVSYRQNNDLIFEFEQSSGNSSYGIEFSTNRLWLYNDKNPISIDGRVLQIDQRQSEEEIILSLEWAKEKLFEIFGREFDSVKVTFDYGESHEYGAENIYIRYYNKTSGIYTGDYIEIKFDNYANSSSETESADILNRSSISYYTYRVPMGAHYSVEGNVKLISLEEAEVLLKKGYVFGGHSCPICMSEQPEVSFNEYDLVGFEYVRGYGEGSNIIPFYTFYKKIGVSQNGNEIYAKTYVCAAEILGYDEYFKAQSADHA